MNKHNFIHAYRKNFQASFHVPPMLNEIKSELTFTPRIIFNKRVLFRLVFELTAAFVMVYLGYSTAFGNINFGLGETVNENRVILWLSLAGLSFLAFLFDITYNYIKVRKKEFKK